MKNNLEIPARPAIFLYHGCKRLDDFMLACEVYSPYNRFDKDFFNIKCETYDLVQKANNIMQSISNNVGVYIRL